jgi:hypothetical protein
MGYIEATESLKYPFLTTRDTSSSREVLEVFKFSPSDGCLAIPMRVLRFEDSGLRRRTPVRPVLLTGQTGLALVQHRLRFFGLGFVDQPRNPVVFW